MTKGDSASVAAPRCARAVAMCIACLTLAAAALQARTGAVPGAGPGQGLPPAVEARMVDVNAACEAELALLPGIGPAMAERIARDRAQRGAFGSLDELRRVKGIGPATLERIRPFAVAGRAA